MENKIILIGYFQQIIELCEEENITIVGIIDNKVVHDLSYPILGTDKDAPGIFTIYGNIPILVTPDNPLLKQKLIKYYGDIGFQIGNLISKKAKISPSAKIGSKNLVIYPDVRVSTNAEICDYVRLHSGCSIDHDTTIGEYSNIAPYAVILGRVTIGKLCYIGANATVLPNLRIGNYSTLGAGAVLTKNIEEGEVWVGNPAKK